MNYILYPQQTTPYPPYQTQSLSYTLLTIIFNILMLLLFSLVGLKFFFLSTSEDLHTTAENKKDY